MSFKQKGTIPTISGNLLKLVNKFTHRDSNISSTESNFNICLMKSWTAIDWLLILWKSDFSIKMKRNFFKAEAISILLYGCTTYTLTKRMEKKRGGNLTRILRAVLNMPESNTSKNSNCTGTYLPSHKTSKKCNCYSNIKTYFIHSSEDVEIEFYVKYDK